MNTEKIRNAKRLADALKRNITQSDQRQLARILNYVPDQLETDINDLWELVIMDIKHKEESFSDSDADLLGMLF